MRKFFFILVVFSLFVVSCDNLYNDVAEEKKDMQKLIFVNADGVSVDLTKDPYGITEWEGFSKVDLNLQTQQVPFLDGSVYLDGLLSERELSVTLAMNDEKNLEKRYRLRRELIEILNPKLGEGTLIYTNNYTSKQIKVIPQTPLFENHNSNDSGTPKASLAWTACNPYWEDVEDTSVIFGIFDVAEIKNEGDVPCSIKADIFSSDVENPTITQLNTGKSISIQGSYEDIIRIDTTDGNKSIMTEKYNNKMLFGRNIFNDMEFIESKQIFVAVGKGVVFTSFDGKYWESQELINSTFNRVIYVEEKGLIIIVGENCIYKSEDGKKWEIAYAHSGNNLLNFKSIVYSSVLDMFVIVGRDHYQSLIGGVVGTSSDLVNWNFITTPNEYTDIAVGTSFVAVNYLGTYISSNGIDWVETEFDTPFTTLDDVKIAYGNNRFCVIGNTSQNKISMTSLNGTSWSNIVTIGTSGSNSLLKRSNKLRGFVSIYNSIYNSKVFISANGSTWTELTDAVSSSVFCDYALGLFLYCYTSAKTINDINPFGNPTYTVDTYTIDNSNNYEVIDIAVSEKEIAILVAGIDNLSYNRSYYIAISKDKGESFEIENIDIPSNATPHNIIYNKYKSIFVLTVYCSSKIIIYTSKNAVDLNMVGEISGSGATDIIYNQYLNKYIMRINNKIYASENLADWTEGDYRFPNSICSGKDKIIVSTSSLSDSNKLYYSENGINYTPCIISNETPNNISSIIYDAKNDIYLASGYSNHPARNDIYVVISHDGINWKSIRIFVAFVSSTVPTLLAYSEEFNTYLLMLTDSTFMQSFDTETWTSVNQNNDNVISGRLFYSDYLKSFIGCGDVAQMINLNVQNNLISQLTNNSDMTMRLEKGVNRIALIRTDGDALCCITYRQKYLGV